MTIEGDPRTIENYPAYLSKNYYCSSPQTFFLRGRMQFCRKTMLVLQSIGMSIDCKAFLMKYVLNCSSLSLSSQTSHAWKVSTWDCNNPMAHISKKEGQVKKHRQGKKLRSLLHYSARERSCHSSKRIRSIFLKEEAGRNNLTLQWILISTFDECES